MDDGTFSIDDLARESGVSTRTIRDYIERGLLPGAEGRGRAASYSMEHLKRLLAILALRRRGRSLDDIKPVVSRADRQEIDALASVASADAARPSSALDYLRSIERGAPSGMHLPPAPPPPTVATGQSSQLGQLAAQLGRLATRRHDARPARSSEWVRVSVTPDLDLAARGPLSTADRLALEAVADSLRDLAGPER